MKKIIPWILAGFFLFLFLVDLIPSCSVKPDNSKDSVYVYKTRIEKQIDTVEKLKTLRGKIEYRTKFDTLATVDTVLIELLKADTIIKIDTKIIARQDTIIAYQGRIIEFQGDSIEVLNSDLKKEKKKVKIFKVTTVAVLLLNLIH